MATNRVINLSNVEDLTAYQISEYVSSGSKWVNFGLNNDYPSYLRSLYLNSPTHQAVCDSTINLTTGEGIEVVDPVQNPLSNKWINENFPKETVKKLVSDLKLYGYAVVEVYDGKLVKYKDAVKYRFDSCDENGNINNVWFSNDWDFYNYKRNKPVKVPLYVQGSTEPVSVCLVQLDKHGFEYYSPVDYNGAINYISLEAEISKYHLTNIKNGLFPSFMINVPGGTEYSVEQMELYERGITNKFGGSAKGGKIMINYIADKESAMTIDTIEQSQLPETYQFLTKEATEKILVGHGVSSPLLFGIRDTGGGLGSNAQELEQSFYLYYESKLKHYQNYIIELVKKVMNGNLLYADVQFKTYNPFAVKDTTQKLSKFTNVNEIEVQETLKHIDNIAIKNDNSHIDTILFTNVNKENLYKFVKSGESTNMIDKKFELLDKDGYIFKGDDLIKNTKNYYFLELVKIKKL